MHLYSPAVKFQIVFGEMARDAVTFGVVVGVVVGENGKGCCQVLGIEWGQWEEQSSFGSGWGEHKRCWGSGRGESTRGIDIVEVVVWREGRGMLSNLW